MSFFINNNNSSRPGPLNNNPTAGLCEKAVIETDKVFDAALSQSTETGVILNVTNYDPANPAMPLTFVSAEGDVNNPATIDNVVISPPQPILTATESKSETLCITISRSW